MHIYIGNILFCHLFQVIRHFLKKWKLRDVVRAGYSETTTIPSIVKSLKSFIQNLINTYLSVVTYIP